MNALAFVKSTANEKKSSFFAARLAARLPNPLLTGRPRNRYLPYAKTWVKYRTRTKTPVILLILPILRV